jgi:hypothetical protein
LDQGGEIERTVRWSRRRAQRRPFRSPRSWDGGKAEKGVLPSRDPTRLAAVHSVTRFHSVACFVG